MEDCPTCEGAGSILIWRAGHGTKGNGTGKQRCSHCEGTGQVVLKRKAKGVEPRDWGIDNVDLRRLKD